MVFGAAAPRVGIDLAADQVFDGGYAVAGDPGGFARRRRHHAVSHHQQAVFVAGDEALDDDAAAFIHRHGIGRFDFVARQQVGEDAASMVAVVGLDDHRQADVLRGLPGVGRALHQPSFGDRHAAGRQQFLGQVLVARYAFGDGAGAVCFGGPDAALPRSVAELHQVALEQPDIGNVAVVGRVHDAGGAGPQAQRVDQGAQPRDGRRHVERAILDGRHHEVASLLQGGARDLFVPGAHHHLVDAAPRGLARLAKPARQAGQVLQFERDVLEDVARPGPFAQALQEAAAHAGAAAVLDQRGQPAGQALVEAGYRVGGEILQFADVHPRFQHRTVRPDVGAAQSHDIEKFNVFLFHGYGGVIAHWQAEVTPCKVEGRRAGWEVPTRGWAEEFLSMEIVKIGCYYTPPFCPYKLALL
ncbi:Uncharacterised protein [Bordetella pertussis]|nr:Uncharacterised protein [Bordetella pertussis]